MGEKPLGCHQCQKAFVTKSAFTYHQKTHCREGKSYGCSKCGKAFPWKSKLTLYQRTHSGERPFRCRVCDKAFRVRTHLTVHQRTHTGEKPYKCSDCEKAFSKKAQLLIHQRTHTGDRPYGCNECLQTFSQKSDLRSRKKTHHAAGKSHQCSECGSFCPVSQLSLYIREAPAQVRSPSHAVPVIKPSHPRPISLYGREFTQERDHMAAQIVRELSPRRHTL